MDEGKFSFAKIKRLLFVIKKLLLNIMNNRNIKVGELRNLKNFQGKYFIQKLNKIIFSEMEKNRKKTLHLCINLFVFRNL